MRSRCASARAVAGSLVLALSSTTGAAPSTRSRVAVVRTAPEDRLLREASTRLRAELGAAGFEVVQVSRAPGDTRAEMESAAQHTQSFATVAIDRAHEGAFADVWITDLVTGKTVVRRLNVGKGEDAAAVLAIRAMELLRASLLEVASPLASSTAPETAPRDVLTWVEPAIPIRDGQRRAPFHGPTLGLGVLGLHSFSGIGPAVGPVARGGYGIGDHWFGRLSLAAPVLAPTLRAPEGKASVTQLYSALEFGWSTDARPFGVFVWAGAGAFYLRTAGSAEAPYRSSTSGAVSFLATGGVGGLARISDSVSCSLEAAVVGLVPHPVVVIAERDVGQAGAPSLSLSFGVSVAL